MSTPTKNRMVRFNIKNLKYAMKDDQGAYETPKELAYANSIVLNPDLNEKPIYMDGEPTMTIIDDKGMTGTLSVVNLEKHYEIDCGRMMEIESGLATIQQRASIQHAIYYETDGLENGVPFTIKVWMFGCTTGRASETYNQTEDDPVINYFDYPLIVRGENLKKATGTEDYVDANGNTVKIGYVTAWPEDTGYATFGDSVPALKARSVT